MTRDVCGVILLRPDGQALMQLRDAIPTITDPGMWVFPGGHCDAEEDHETCARRVVFEETRYRCSDLRHLVTFTRGSGAAVRRTKRSGVPPHAGVCHGNMGLGHRRHGATAGLYRAYKRLS
jgi:8-oxo-dGTP pyrophosphatase MutT (NUDIX family)